MDNTTNEKWVLHICNKLSVGGVQKFIMTHYENVDKSKVQFAFAVQRDVDYDYDSDLTKMGGRIHKMPKMNENLFGYIRSLIKILKDHPEYRIVHAHMHHRNAIALMVCKFMGIPVRISHAHNLGSKLNFIATMRVKLFKRILLSVATDFFACSKSAEEYLHGGYGNYEIIKNAIDSRKFVFCDSSREKMRKSLGLGAEFVVGHVGNFTEQKNYKQIIDVFSKLKRDSKLILVGTGSLLENVKSYAKQNGVLDRVIFLGVRDDIHELMQVFDCFLFPSFFEGLGIVAIEAQASGLPTYCSDGVPNEVDITNLVVHIPLSAPIEEWVDIIEKGRDVYRRDMFNEIVKAGYDINHNAKFIEDYYLGK